MKLTQHLVNEAFETSVHKLAILVLSIISLTFALLLAMDFSKDALVVERGCESRLAEIASSSQSSEEIEKFVRESLILRFDSQTLIDPSAFMVTDLLTSREQEQRELRQSKIDQKMIIRSVELSGDHFEVHADRILAVGDVRSALPIKLKVKVSAKKRSMTNPYGLLLTSVENVTKEEKKNE